MITRELWNGQIVPAMGLGCWAIGGPFSAGDQPLGWGMTDDATSIAALHAAYDAGVRLFDTSDAYGTGHSETLLGKAFGDRSDVNIATKFGNTYDSSKRQLIGIDLSPGYIQWAVEQSLRRLQVERISLYQLHVDTVGSAADEIADTLEGLCQGGKIETFGWSTDSPEEVHRWIGRRGFVAVQHAMNLFTPAEEMAALCISEGLLSINRSPLAMGLLTAKFERDAAITGDDIRATPPEWLPYFNGGRPQADFARALDAVRELLSTGGRSLAQGALGWIWSRSAVTIPIPGFRTPEQVAENTGALDHGPLPASVTYEIDAILTSLAEGHSV